MESDIKGILSSKTIWGAVLAIAASLASMGGFNLGDPSGIATDVVALVGALVAVYGRIKAVKKIG